jgi:hypothetical protein
MGKGWAKGLTKATDPRVGRAAATHTGMQYRPRGNAAAQVEWSESLAYVVGLIATDGCLISGRTQIGFVSLDKSLCEVLLRILGRANKIRPTRTQSGATAYRVQFGDAPLYRWLQSIGLTPRKSLTLGAIVVPDAHVFSLVRGLLDGDGSVLTYTHRGTGKAKGTYEALRVRFCSASEEHVRWLREILRARLGISGWIVRTERRGRPRPTFYMCYGNVESARLLKQLYADPTSPALDRKRLRWIAYAVRHAVG